MVHHGRPVGHSAPFVNYYVNQARGRLQNGSGLPAFGGVRYQRGHGLGSIFGSIFSKIKGALPWFFKTAAKHVMQTGANVANDMLEGAKFKESVKERGLEGAKSAAEVIVPRAIEGIKSAIREDRNKDTEPQTQEGAQEGSGKRKYRTIRRPKKIKRLRQDIFG